MSTEHALQGFSDAPLKPVAIDLDGKPSSVAPGTTLAQLVALLGHRENAVTTAVNGLFVPRTQRAGRLLITGDQVVLFQAIVGG